MQKCIKTRFLTITKASLFLFFVLVVSGCFISKSKFIKRISKMSNETLVSYYHGINERIKDIGNIARTKTRCDYTEHDMAVARGPFIFGGEAYKLEQKRQLLLAELSRRNISLEIYR